jgi:hypothetical protein
LLLAAAAPADTAAAAAAAAFFQVLHLLQLELKLSLLALVALD